MTTEKWAFWNRVLRGYPGAVDSRAQARRMCRWMNSFSVSGAKEYVVRKIKITGKRGPGSYIITTAVQERPADIKFYDRERAERPERAEIARLEAVMEKRGKQ